MAKMAICDGVLKIVGGPSSPFQCFEADGITVKAWEIIDYVEPADSTAIYAQLVALNDFNPAQIASIVTFCMFLFITGFGVGMVINRLRRS